MGEIINIYDLDLVKTHNLMKPIIYCNTPNEIMNLSVSINILLSKELKKQNSNMMRTMRMESNLCQVLNTIGEAPVIKEFDVMFNPSYDLDVIKTLINVCRKKQFSVIWLGKYENGKLYYAEEGYKDYKVYNIEDYDITVVV